MNMKKLKRMLCWILAVTIVLGLLPSTVLATSSNGFKDVKDGDWFKEAVEYVTAEGLMVGVGGNKFDPNGQTTRAMVVTVLHRMEGTPTASSAGFDDVAKNLWYTDAINWAQANGIVQGYGDGTFRPDVTMTREEMVAVFYRYSEHKGYDTTATNTLSAYSDHKTIQKYAVNAMDWAVSVGLITGFPDGTIRPQGESTRAQLATVLMRFAEIEVAPDDGKDEEDTEVSVDDKSLLSASTYEVLAESATDVVFYVNSTLTVPYFELMLNGKSTGIYLYDDGNYTTNGDDIPNDGCYTGSYIIDLDSEGDITFAARAVVGGTTVYTNEISIFVYYELTDEQCTFMDEVSATIKRIIAETKAALPNGTASEEVAESICQALTIYLNSLQEAGQITNLYIDKDNYTISFTYMDTGICSFVVYHQNSEADIPVNGSSNNTSQANLMFNPQSEATKSSINIDADYITYKEKALFLIYCEEDVTYDEDGTGYLLVEGSKEIAEQLDNSGFEVELRYSVTVDDFKTLHDYQYVRIACHGSYLSGLFIDNSPVICTDQAVTSSNKKVYSADLKKNRIFDVATVDENNNPLGNFYWIHPDFFTFYYKEDSMKANILHISCCKGAYKDDMVNAFLDIGVSSVVAYTEKVYTLYDYELWTVIIPELLNGASIEDATNTAIDRFGDNDCGDWFNKHWPDKTPKSEVARCRVFGAQSTKIHNGLLNGSFDATVNLISDNIAKWKLYGDARSIFKLSGIKPVSASKMAIISSGFGSLNDETTSGIYQTILVPGDASDIEFCYDVVSEEPMEYVGSEFDDIFQVDILNTAGEVLETLVYESVNTSQWYAIEGINFPEGDDTTYHTRWQKYSSNIIEKYRGQLIVLRFVVQDAGDAIYDTAALIDSVVVN